MGTLNLTRGVAATFQVTGYAFNSYAILYINLNVQTYAGPYRTTNVVANGPDWNSPATITFEISASQVDEMVRSVEYSAGGCGSGQSVGTYFVHGHNYNSPAINDLDSGTINISGLRECDEDEDPAGDGGGSGGEGGGGEGGGGGGSLGPYGTAPVDGTPTTDPFGPRDSYGPLGSTDYTPGGGGPAGFG